MWVYKKAMLGLFAVRQYALHELKEWSPNQREACAMIVMTLFFLPTRAGANVCRLRAISSHRRRLFACLALGHLIIGCISSVQ